MCMAIAMRDASIGYVCAWKHQSMNGAWRIKLPQQPGCYANARQSSNFQQRTTRAACTCPDSELSSVQLTKQKSKLPELAVLADGGWSLGYVTCYSLFWLC
jgi:hypothetical protein